ncbi:hypothetical protein C8R43DRAFT_944652 [Mycena crocata]|nr:hypothetical protein C8R43DRAFT_944652 [Mycena crocata]
MLGNPGRGISRWDTVSALLSHTVRNICIGGPLKCTHVHYDATLVSECSSAGRAYQPSYASNRFFGVLVDYLIEMLQLAWVSTRYNRNYDESLNPWTFHVLVLGLGLSAFGGVLAEIYYFKPQTVLVSTMFLAIIVFVLGKAMESIIPTSGIFRFLNPASELIFISFQHLKQRPASNQ